LFQWILYKLGLYEAVAVWSILITLAWIAEIIGDQEARNRKGILIYLYDESILVQLWGAHLNGQTQLVIVPQSIISMEAHPDFETRLFPGELGAMKGEGGSAWPGWHSFMDNIRDINSIIALETKELKLALYCRNPVELVAKIREIYGESVGRQVN